MTQQELLNPADKSMIRNMMLTKPHLYISTVLGKPLEVVAAYVTELTQGTEILTFQKRMEMKRSAEPKKQRVPREKKARPVKPKSMTEQWEEKLDERKRNNSERVRVDQERKNEKRLQSQKFKTKDVDYSQKVMIRIDRTTYIYAVRGKEKETRENFLKTYLKPIQRI